MSRNDFNNILKFSSELLSHYNNIVEDLSKEVDAPVSISPINHTYLLTAAVLASIALDDNEGALSILEKYNPNDIKSLLIDLLSNYAMQKHYLFDS